MPGPKAIVCPAIDEEDAEGSRKSLLMTWLLAKSSGAQKGRETPVHSVYEQ